MAFCTIANKISHSEELIKKFENIADKQPQYVRLQFDFMKDFENSETCQMKN